MFNLEFEWGRLSVIEEFSCWENTVKALKSWHLEIGAILFPMN